MKTFLAGTVSRNSIFRRMGGVGWFLIWFTAVQVAANQPQLQILNPGLSKSGAFQMQIDSRSVPFEVQASTNLLSWIAVGTNGPASNLVEFTESGSKSWPRRFYRLREHARELALSRTNAAPGDRLEISSGLFDPSARTQVRFLDPSGSTVVVRAFLVTSNAVSVAVPFMIRSDAPQVHGGSVRVQVEQEAAATNLTFATAPSLNILDLPSVELPAGTITLEYLNQISNLLAAASSHWQTIETASGAKVDTTSLRSNLRSLQTNVMVGQALVQGIMSGTTPRLVLGSIQGREVVLDSDALALLDRMILASVNYGVQEARFARRTSSLAAGSDTLSRVDEAFNPGQSSQATFEMFDDFNAIGGMGVGVLAASAVVLGVASAPAAAAMAGTAGAVLFFATYVAPAVIGSSALALAAPFIEVQTGQQVVLEDYRPALDHIQKGSQAYLVDEVQGNLLNGVLASRGASEDLIARASLFVSTSKSLLGDLDLSNALSPASRAVANSETIFTNLRPIGSVRKYVGTLAENFKSGTTDGVWAEHLTATVTMIVSGQGTMISPFAGSFLFEGTMSETLLSCNSVDVPCDPGGTYILKLDSGLVTGSTGILAGEGTGTVTRDGMTAPITFQFQGGVMSGNSLTGTLVIGEEFAQSLVTLMGE